MKCKKLIVTGIAIFSLVVFLAIFLTLWFWGDNYPDFNGFKTIETRSGETLEIPGLKDGAVPQGIANYTTSYTYTDVNGNEIKGTQEYFFISAYMKKGPSRIYVTGSRTGYVGYVTLKNEDGTDYYGHAGGIATNCKSDEKTGTLWVVSNKKEIVDGKEQKVGYVYCAQSRNTKDYNNIAEEVIKKAALKEGDKSIQFKTSFKANNQASFCFYYDNPTNSTDSLYVGEFYRAGDDRYSTAKNHHVKTLSGNKQYAFVYEYSTSTSTESGLMELTANVNNKVPKINKIISIPDKIQGFARTSNNQLVLSQSYGLPNSHLYYYDWSEITSTASTNRTLFSVLTENNFEYEGVYYEHPDTELEVKYTDSSLYVYFADKSRAIRDYSVPSMAEGMCVNGENIYVLFESGCYKYKLFVRQQIMDIYYFTPPPVKNN